jgi:hypothetical protein
MDVAVKVDPNIHEAFSAIAKIQGTGIGELAERLIKEFVAADCHQFNLRLRSNAYRRISENIEESPGSAP